MTTLLLQTFLLLLGSFFLGCVVACAFRRVFFADTRPVDVPKAVAPRPAAVFAPAPSLPRPGLAPSESARFERALSGRDFDISATRTAASPGIGPVVEVEPPAPRLPSAPLTAGHTSASDLQAAPVRPAVPAAPIPAAPVSPYAPPPAPQQAQTPAPPPAASTVAAAPAAAMPPLQGAPTPSASAQPADDLTRIRAIDNELQTRLNRLGVNRYSEIAVWAAGDVNRMSQSLGFAGRIEQENWIEQAQILAKGGETDYSRRRAQGMTTAGTSPAPASAAAAPVPAAAAPAPAAAAPTPAPSAPQPSAAKPATEEPAVRPFGVSPRGIAGDAAAAATAAAIAAASQGATRTPSQAPAPALAPALVPAVTVGGDRLHRILGISADAERILHANGVTRFAEIAAWSPADVDRFDGLLGRPGRIGRENWIEQAKVLIRPADEGDANRPVRFADAIRDTDAARPAAPRSDIGSLRSVRSEALRGDVAMSDTVRPSVLTRSIGGFEDLKRIRGIGVLIEKRLNSLGISTYEHVANWTGADIDRISQILDFKGRIERENWIEQARILAAGGHTEFSRRVDRGDVESSKPVR